MQLKFLRLEEKGQPSSEQQPQSCGGSISRCIWCDSTNHFQKDCDTFKYALCKGNVFLKDGKIHLWETSLHLGTNFQKGGMRKLVDDVSLKHALAVMEAVTYGLQVECSSKKGIELKDKIEQVNEIFPYAMKIAEKGEVARDALHQVGDYI